MKIGEHTIDAAVQLVNNLLSEHLVKLNTAYLHTEQELTVSMSLKFRPTKDTREIIVDAAINFVTDRVKDTAQALVTEGQDSLWEGLRDGSVQMKA